MKLLGPYIARRRLFVLQAPGKKPSLLRLDPGDVFSFEGDEPGLNAEDLMRSGTIQVYRKLPSQMTSLASSDPDQAPSASAGKTRRA